MAKRALVIGVDNYSILDPSGDSNLSTCVRDARAISKILKEKFKFDDIYHYENFKASSENIVTTLGNLASYSEPGDVLFFYFSGHGARVRQDLKNPDDDTYYETIIPSSGKWLTDKDFTEAIDRLDSDMVNITVITDTAHAGCINAAFDQQQCKTLAFSEDLIRIITAQLSTIVPFGLGLDSAMIKDNVVNSTPRAEGVEVTTRMEEIPLTATKATLVTACNFDEISWILSGDKSSAFTKALLNILQTSEEITHLELVNELKEKVKTNLAASGNGLKQTPQIFVQDTNALKSLFSSYAPASIVYTGSQPDSSTLRSRLKSRLDLHNNAPTNDEWSSFTRLGTINLFKKWHEHLSQLEATNGEYGKFYGSNWLNSANRRELQFIKEKNLVKSSCISWQMQVLEDTYKEMNWEEKFKLIQKYYKRVGNIGLGVIKRLQEEGWTILAIKIKDTNKATKYLRWPYKENRKQIYKLDKDGVVFCDFPSKETNALDQVEFFVGMVDLGYHTYLGYKGLINDFHYSESYQSPEIITEQPINDFFSGYDSATIAIPPNQFQKSESL